MENAEQGKQDRVKRAIEKIAQALVEEQCFLEPSITILGRQISDAKISVFAKDIPADTVPTNTPEVVSEPVSDAPQLPTESEGGAN